MNARTYIFALSLAIAAGATLWATQAVRRLSSEVADLRQQLEDRESGPASEGALQLSPRETPPPGPQAPMNWNRRFEDLEGAVAQLARASEYLIERGQLPLPTDRVEGLARAFSDAAAADRDRLRTLEQLRRNRGLSDDVVHQALDWLQSSTNASTRRELLRQLAGVTNAAVKGPLLGLIGSEPDENVREEAAQNLRRFTDDPAVESALWNTALADPDEDVRDEAREALREGPVTEARLAALRERALNPQAGLDEQLIALDALREAKAPTSDIVAGMAGLAESTQDPLQRAQLFQAFDDLDDPVTKVPLVLGLQDANPLVREEAADALSRHAGDPAVREWLQYVSSHDADPAVRREALQALQDRRR